MTNVSKIFDFILYADDTTLSSTLSCFKNNNTINDNINDQLNEISEWLKLNKLSLNIKKTKYMIFHKPKKQVATISLNIDDTVIEKVKDFNFLGLELNKHLTWKTHTNKVSNSISKTIGILNRLKHFLPIKIKLTLYNSLTLSHINYCLLIWEYENEKVTKLQQKAVRLITISKYNAHTEPIFKKLKFLKVEDILKLQQLKCYFKYTNNMLPWYFNKQNENHTSKFYLKLNKNTHDHNT